MQQQQLHFVAEVFQIGVCCGSAMLGQFELICHSCDGGLHGAGKPENPLQVILDLAVDIGSGAERQEFFCAVAVVVHHQQCARGNKVIGIVHSAEDAASFAGPAMQVSDVLSKIVAERDI